MNPPFRKIFAPDIGNMSRNHIASKVFVHGGNNKTSWFSHRDGDITNTQFDTSASNRIPTYSKINDNATPKCSIGAGRGAKQAIVTNTFSTFRVYALL